MKKIIKENKAWKSYEISYTGKPTEAILLKLRKSAFKWAPTKKLWHARINETNRKFAESLGTSVKTQLSIFDIDEPIEVKSPAKAKKTIKAKVLKLAKTKKPAKVKKPVKVKVLKLAKTKKPIRIVKDDKKEFFEAGAWNKFISSKDIPYRTAYMAHNGTSFSPEKRALSQKKDYYYLMIDYYKEIVGKAKPEQKDLAETLFVELATGYKKRLLAYLHSRNGLMSTMITGASNFPVRRMNKKNDVIHKKLNELVEYPDYKLRKIKLALKPDHLKPIKTGQDNALELLEKKLAKLEKDREQMKAVNKIVKKKSSSEASKISDLMAFGLSENNAKEFLRPDYAGRIGVPDYSLTNLGAEIRRLQGRINQEKQMKVKAAESKASGGNETSFSGGNIVKNHEINRLQILFDEKPEADMRGKLKSLGFKWAPSLGAWQTFLNSFPSYKQTRLNEILGIK